MAWSNTQNTLATALMIAGGAIGLATFLRTEYLMLFPVSTLTILGYVAYYFILPPLATLASGVTLTNNIEHPVLVMVNALVCLIALMIAHAIYRRGKPLRALRDFVSERIYSPLGFFRVPSTIQLFLMGFLGLAAIAYMVFSVGIYSHRNFDVTQRLIEGFYPAAYLPFVAVLKEPIGGQGRIDRKWFVILIFYACLMSYVLIATNSRFMLLGIFVSVGLVYLYGLAIGIYEVDKRLMRRASVAVAVAFLLSGPITDLAISLVIVRGMRSDLTAGQLISATINTFKDRDLVNSYEELGSGHGSLWNEQYTGNLFFDRLCNLKYADNSLALAQTIRRVGNGSFTQEQVNRVLSELPAPFIHFLGLDVNKSSTISGSAGDYMLADAAGRASSVGGFRTGSILGSGYALFGWWYPAVLALLALLIFPLADSLTITAHPELPLEEGEYILPVLSPMLVVSFFSWCVFFTSAANGNDSLAGVAGYVIRGWVQVAFVYFIVYWITYLPARVFE